MNNFYEIYQPKISIAQKLLGLRVFKRENIKIREDYDIDVDTFLHDYPEEALIDLLNKLRRIYEKSTSISNNYN